MFDYEGMEILVIHYFSSLKNIIEPFLEFRNVLEAKYNP